MHMVGLTYKCMVFDKNLKKTVQLSVCRLQLLMFTVDLITSAELILNWMLQNLEA